MNQQLLQQFDRLSELLHRTQIYWRPTAYHSQSLPWMAQHPELARELLALPRQRLESLATNSGALIEFMLPYLPMVRELSSLAAVDNTPSRPERAVAAHFHAGIPGRKWQQVESFARCVAAEAPMLEWCAGKSHLGFYLQHCSGQAVTALEWNEALVAEARARAARDGVPLHSWQVDVLSSRAEGYLGVGTRAVALHACGELHERLLQLVVQHGAREVHLAPCCYHKRLPEHYRPLSRQGRSVSLALNKQELHTAVMETATAGAGAVRQRQRLQVMRLGFDELQRDLRGTSDYLPLPSLPAKWARADFESFCRYCAALKQLPLALPVNWDHYQSRGEQRFWRVSALDLVRFLFRRPIEVWLALDRALLLHEHGYRVHLGAFCPTSVTPRNLLLQGWRT